MSHSHAHVNNEKKKDYGMVPYQWYPYWYHSGMYHSGTHNNMLDDTSLFMCRKYKTVPPRREVSPY